MYKARIVLDSTAPSGSRLTTFEVTYPRFVHSEMLTHRMFSRNSSSSRAIPVQRMMERVLDDPVLPVKWGKNQKGMQAERELTQEEIELTERVWLEARDDALKHATRLLELGVHKQITNRLLEPWMWITVIISATEWSNFWHLRCSPMAQPEIEKIARMMYNLYQSNQPHKLEGNDWHLPYVSDWDDEFSLEDRIRLSVGRCARVSYLTHDGQRDPTADLALHDRLLSDGHISPFEHQARALGDNGRDYRSGNFAGWEQYRKTIVGECK